MDRQGMKMPQSTAVHTGVPDLHRVELSQLLQERSARFSGTVRALVARVEQPGRSISGYNPQRLD
jgi:hypothetical protein